MALIKVLKTWQRSVTIFANKHKVLRRFCCACPFTSSLCFGLFFGPQFKYKYLIFDISLVIAMVWVISSVPLTISGAGVRELSMIHFLSSYGSRRSAQPFPYLYTLSRC